MTDATRTARDLLASNRTVAVFIGKMVAAYAVWFVVYDLWLLPHGGLDEWLSTRVAGWTAAVLAPFGEAVEAGRVVRFEGAAIEIVDGCNGLSALSLFVGFVLAFPGSWVRRALFIPAGMAVIVATNVVRCASLLVVSARVPSVFDSVHGFHALFVFYVVIFGLWVAWTHVGEPSSRPRPVPA